VGLAIARGSHRLAAVQPGDPSDAAVPAWRAEVVAFLDAHARLRSGLDDWSASPVHDDSAAELEYFERCRAWQRTVFDGGYAGITWPGTYGGRDGAPWQHAVYQEEEARYDVSSGFIASTIALAGAALLAHGTEPQKQRYLRPLLRADEVWCQLFSEPDAGSDLANLHTTAVVDGDEYVVNGQKMWTSGAHHADFGLLLARTDSDAPKHRGMTFFILDMRTAGVDVRPLRQMTGAAHFNEVFFAGARAPRNQILGEVHRGWAVARTVLAAESSMIGNSLRFDVVDLLTHMMRRNGRARDPLLRQAFARVVTGERILGLLRARLRDDVLRGARPSVDGSVLKLLWSQAWAARAELGARLCGASTVAHTGDADAAYWRAQVLNRFSGSIGGGTDEIHKNHVGERVLGLPPEPRVDRELPWRETRRARAGS
jgi:alkylation response protein AidB-like acyl-CoA dehydrogenase